MALPAPWSGRQKIAGLYGQAPVRTRMLEFLGGNSPPAATSLFLTLGTEDEPRHLEPRAVSEFDSALSQRRDISRSLWDKKSLLIHLDVDYVNFDAPLEAFAHPHHAFELMAPVARITERWLREHGVTPLHALSGRGHHFVWRILREGPVFDRLTQMGYGRVPPSLREHYRQGRPPIQETVSVPMAEAYLGLGLLMEYVAHILKRLSQETTSVPVELTCLGVGQGAHGREMIALDISEYGDPLDVRVIRVPFSVYYKPIQQLHAMRWTLPEEEPALFLMPMDGMPTGQGVEMMRDPERLADLAARISCVIPDQSFGTNALLADYEASALRRFHETYYAEAMHPPDQWARTYDLTPQGVLPGCVRFVLEHPNDLLLNLSCLQRVVRVFLSLGWHPRHVAGLIYSVYRRNGDWGDQWCHLDPAWRAEFYTRLFSGSIFTGLDRLIDFNCRSAQEEDLCFVRGCQDNLADYRKSLSERKHHERLARRPIHRLFLPESNS